MVAEEQNDRRGRGRPRRLGENTHAWFTSSSLPSFPGVTRSRSPAWSRQPQAALGERRQPPHCRPRHGLSAFYKLVKRSRRLRTWLVSGSWSERRMKGCPAVSFSWQYMGLTDQLTWQPPVVFLTTCLPFQAQTASLKPQAEALDSHPFRFIDFFLLEELKLRTVKKTLSRCKVIQQHSTNPLPQQWLHKMTSKTQSPPAGRQFCYAAKKPFWHD